MSEEQERYFSKLVPMRSLLGREFLTIQAERNKQRQIFQSSPNKMAADTLAYRRAEIALGRFLDDMIPRVEKADVTLLGIQDKLKAIEDKAKDPVRGISLNRQDVKTIWNNFAIERYNFFAHPLKAQFKKYHPSAWKELEESKNKFENELNRWVFGGHPFDGSQAMNDMLDFQLKCRLVAAHND